jgi:apolipoprotein N-acyltransferase
VSVTAGAQTEAVVLTTPRRIALAILSGLLLAAAFPSASQGWAAWIGLVPLLVAMRGLRPWRAAALAWITGFLWQVSTIYWIPATISNFTRISPLIAKSLLLMLAAFSAYPFVILAFACEWAAAAGLSRLVVAPLVWPFAEWLRVVVIAGFPWNPLGNSQIVYPVMAQAADIGSVYLLSSILVLANAAIAEAVARRGAVPREGKGKGAAASPAARAVAIAAACPLFLFAYGTWRLHELSSTAYTGAVRIGIVQGNIAQDQKWNATLRDHILTTYLDLTGKAASDGAQLVVWPEAALPFYIQRDMHSLELTKIARERHIDLLVGAPGIEEHEGKPPTPYNQAWLVRNDGSLEGPYDKIQLVPFGEYIPLYGLFGMVDIAVQAVGQLGQGQDLTVFESVDLSAPPQSQAGAAPTEDGHPRQARFSTLICYEGIFPSLTRQFAAQGLDFLVNISNDAWYGDTSAPHQHLAMAAMRAIENRLPMVRSTNTGISAFIDDTGRVGGTTPLFQQAYEVETVKTRQVWSFYRIYGDVFLYLCQAATLAIVFVTVRRRRAAA